MTTGKGHGLWILSSKHLGGGIMMVGPESRYPVVLVVHESTGRGVDYPLRVALYSQSA